MAYLPEPGSDDNNWGTILNTFLRVAHREDGEIRGLTAVTNVKDHGVKGNGEDDDTDALQALIDSLRGNTPVPPITETANIYFPQGKYLLKKPLRIYTGQHLFGQEFGAHLVANSGFSGAALLSLEGTPKYYTTASIANLAFFSAAGSGIAAIQANAEVVGNSIFRDLHLFTANGLLLNTYTQFVEIFRIYSAGPVETILHLSGNFNRVRGIDKEGGETGHSDTPYILVSASKGFDATGNHLENILIEGETSPSKSALVLDKTAATTITNFWNEATVTDGVADTNGYAMQILNSRISTHLKGVLKYISDDNRLRIVNSNGVHIDNLVTDGKDIPFSSVIEIDERSTVTVGQIYSRRGRDAFRLDQIDRRLFVAEHFTRQIATDQPSGYLPRSRVTNSAIHNLLRNPSFEAGLFGWRITARPMPVTETVSSEVAPGRMIHFSWPTPSKTSISNVWQTVEALPGWLGKTMTLTALVRIDGDGCWVNPYLDGAGITQSTGYTRVYGNTGWQIMTQSFTILAAGSLNVGFTFVNVGQPLDAYVDDVSLGFGVEGLRGTANFQSLELGNRSMLNGVVAPTTGDWKQGDIVWNAEPTIQEVNTSRYIILGWVCVASGSPGTWTAIKTDILS